VNPDELRSELNRLGLSQVGAGKVLAVEPRTVRRWAAGEVAIPQAVAMLLPKLSPKEVARIMRTLTTPNGEQ
jgi:hypothetical protein